MKFPLPASILTFSRPKAIGPALSSGIRRRSKILEDTAVLAGRAFQRENGRDQRSFSDTDLRFRNRARFALATPRSP
jgi:hypothetical protein